MKSVYTGVDYLKDENGDYISWLTEMPDHWCRVFGEQMADELNELLIKYNYADQYEILQIKEKFGSLRWYDGGYLPEMRDEYLYPSQVEGDRLLIC